MNSPNTLAAIRKLITEAKNEKAAEQLLSYIQDAPPPAATWRNKVSNLLAQYKRVKLQMSQSTVSYEEGSRAINKVTNGLLTVLASIERGEPAPSLEQSAVTGENGGYSLWLVGGVITALVLSVVAIFLLRGNNDQPDGPSQKQGVFIVEEEMPTSECPAYDKLSEFNILILPFLPLDGELQSIERPLAIRLAERMEEYGVNGAIGPKKIDVNSSDYPLTATQANVLGGKCNAQLIIWGTTEKLGQDLITTTKFSFINNEHFSITDLELNSQAAVDTVTSLSGIATTAELTENIEASLRLIFGLVARETGNHALAAETLGKVVEERGGISTNINWAIIQADSYIKAGEYDEAIKIYEKLYQQDSTNVQALLRKGLLEIRSGQIMQATKDFDRVLEMDPDNTQALTARAAANVELSRLPEARADLQKLDDMGEGEEVKPAIREKYQQRRSVEEAKLQDANQRLERNPEDTAAWRIKAQTARQIGDDEQAQLAASNLLRVDPNNQVAFEVLQAVIANAKTEEEAERQIRLVMPQLNTRQIRTLRRTTRKGGQ